MVLPIINPDMGARKVQPIFKPDMLLILERWHDRAVTTYFTASYEWCGRALQMTWNKNAAVLEDNGKIC